MIIIIHYTFKICCFNFKSEDELNEEQILIVEFTEHTINRMVSRITHFFGVLSNQALAFLTFLANQAAEIKPFKA